VNAVTGAFSFTGRAIAEELLARGEPVRSLSRRAAPPGDPLRDRIDIAPLRFDQTLTDALAGIETLYNTYWIRFERGGATYERAVKNSIALFEAAREAGVRRIVHVSVANADRADDLPYFRGKHRLERWLEGSGLNYAIVRPTLIFGPGDILINNIAWIVRRFPVFLVPGRGDYLVQPVSLRDTAQLCVDAPDGATVDAAGPETLEFRRLVELVAQATNCRCRTLPGPRVAIRPLIGLAGLALRDVIVTVAELDGLSRSLLTSSGQPTGRDSFRSWLEAHGAELGRRYVSELARNYRGAE
jgi:uncharacterized protein YbjT (DUF2867 family)